MTSSIIQQTSIEAGKTCLLIAAGRAIDHSNITMEAVLTLGESSKVEVVICADCTIAAILTRDTI